MFRSEALEPHLHLFHVFLVKFIDGLIFSLHVPLSLLALHALKFLLHPLKLLLALRHAVAAHEVIKGLAEVASYRVALILLPLLGDLALGLCLHVLLLRLLHLNLKLTNYSESRSCAFYRLLDQLNSTLI